MDPGAGTSVQCLSLGTLLLAGMFIPASLDVVEPPWWDVGTKRTVLMGAMVRREMLFGKGASTAGID